MTSYRNRTPCYRCGREGDQIWVDSDHDMCAWCRNEGKMQETEVQKQLAVRQTETDGLKARCTDLDVYSEETYAEAAREVQKVKALAKAIDAEKRSVTKPLNDALTRIRGWFRPVETGLAECAGILNGKILEYQQAIAETNAEALDSARTAVDAGDNEAASEALATIQEDVRAEGVTITERWDFRVCNIGMVPTEYLTIDTAKVRAEMREQVKDGREPCIPGITFFKQQGVMVRT